MVLRNFLKWLSEVPLSATEKQGQLLIEIGKKWAGIEADFKLSETQKAEVQKYIYQLGMTGKHEANYYALLERDQDKRRFVVHNKGEQWKIIYWYGTFLKGDMPDFYDNEGIDFYEQDVKSEPGFILVGPDGDISFSGIAKKKFNNGKRYSQHESKKEAIEKLNNILDSLSFSMT